MHVGTNAQTKTIQAYIHKDSTHTKRKVPHTHIHAQRERKRETMHTHRRIGNTSRRTGRQHTQKNKQRIHTDTQ